MTTSSRRNFLIASLGAGLTLAAAPGRAASGAGDIPGGFRYCLNTSTIMGQKLGVAKEIEVAAKAGFQSVELWVRAIDEYVNKGGSLADLRKRLDDQGLTFEGAISFCQWIVDDPAQRAKALEQARREMEMLAQLGCKRIAAPPIGANKGAVIDLLKVAERYRALLELGDLTGVTPALELWGASTNLHRLGQCAFVAIETGHPKANILPDVYHIYKGGSDYAGLNLLGPQAIQVCHINDYPANPPRETITDRDRVYPGDGSAPLKKILADLRRVNPNMVLSLELFNQDYWKLDALEVAKTGLAKMKQAVQQAVEA